MRRPFLQQDPGPRIRRGDHRHAPAPSPPGGDAEALAPSGQAEDPGAGAWVVKLGIGRCLDPVHLVGLLCTCGRPSRARRRQEGVDLLAETRCRSSSRLRLLQDSRKRIVGRARRAPAWAPRGRSWREAARRCGRSRWSRFRRHRCSSPRGGREPEWVVDHRLVDPALGHGRGCPLQLGRAVEGSDHRQSAPQPEPVVAVGVGDVEAVELLEVETARGDVLAQGPAVLGSVRRQQADPVSDVGRRK